MSPDERAAWQEAEAVIRETHGASPILFAKGYACLSGTHTALIEMGYHFSDHTLEPEAVASVAEGIEERYPAYVEANPERMYYADIARLFFRTAARFQRGVTASI